MDFSGYSDIAIGTSRLFGYRIMENFNWPFLKPNIGKFWMSWHISLTRWLQEYVYWALGGNKKGLARSIIYSFITMGLLGLWHGSGTGIGHYILFGFYHAILIIIYRFWRKFRTGKLAHIKPTKLGYVVSVIVTFEFLNLGWPIFLHPFDKALTIWAKCFGMDINVKMWFLSLLQ
jgi:alginate O-acetyltransferase complex protein AlgI